MEQTLKNIKIILFAVMATNYYAQMSDSKLCKTYFGEDSIDVFLNDRIKESEYCPEVIETEFNKPLALTEKDHEDFNNSTKSRICRKAYERGKAKVKDNDRVTGNYRGSAHQECNLNLSLSKKNPCCNS